MEDFFEEKVDKRIIKIIKNTKKVSEPIVLYCNPTTNQPINSSSISSKIIVTGTPDQ